MNTNSCILFWYQKLIPFHIKMHMLISMFYHVKRNVERLRTKWIFNMCCFYASFIAVFFFFFWMLLSLTNCKSSLINNNVIILILFEKKQRKKNKSSAKISLIFNVSVFFLHFFQMLSSGCQLIDNKKWIERWHSTIVNTIPSLNDNNIIETKERKKSLNLLKFKRNSRYQYVPGDSSHVEIGRFRPIRAKDHRKNLHMQ